MAPVKTPTNLREALDELKEASDRAAILVGATLVEFALERVIAIRLRAPADDKEKAKLFSRDGIFETFSEKIWAAYYLKIIGPVTRQNLDLIRRIRNYAAHNPNAANFQATSEIASRCREFQLPDAYNRVSSEKVKFTLTVCSLATDLMTRSADATAVIATAFENLAPDLDM